MDHHPGVDLLGLPGQPLHVAPGAGLVVHHHAGHQDGGAVHLVQHPVHIKAAVGLGGHKHHLPAAGGQLLQRPPDAGVLKAGADNLFAVGLGEGAAQQGQVVALAAAGGEIELFGLAAHGAGQLGPGMVHGGLALGPRPVEGGRVCPVFQHGGVDYIGHRRVHQGGGCVVQIMQRRVCAHQITCFLSRIPIL